MNLFKGIYRLLSRCWKAGADEHTMEHCEPDAVVHISTAGAVPHHPSYFKAPQADTTKPNPKPKPCIPEIFTKHYAKVVPTDVSADEAVCLTSDVAVLGDAAVKGDSCITGNVLIAGVLRAKGSICVTGNAIVLGSAKLQGQICVTGDAFVGGDLSVVGKLDVGGKLCVFGSKDIQPDH